VTTIFFPLFEWMAGADHQDTLRSRNNLGSWNSLALSHLAAGRPAKAIPLYKRTLADCERVLGADHPNTLRSRNNLAMSYQAAGRTAEAIPLLERTLADCERVLGADHQDTRAARENLAALTGEQKRHRHL
jgi:tetratricopeptide (TPR) repeat protein